MSQQGWKTTSPRRKTLSFFPSSEKPEQGSLFSPPNEKRRKSTRSSLAPSRSILKASNYDDNHTVIGVMQVSVKDEPPIATSKKIPKRRVSFAPEATLHTFELVEHQTFPEPPVPARKRESTNPKETSQLASIFSASAAQNVQSSIASPQKKVAAPLFNNDKGKAPSLFGNSGLFPLFGNTQANEDSTIHSTHTNNDESDMEIESTAGIFAATKASFMGETSTNGNQREENLISITPPKENGEKSYKNIYPSIENFAADLGSSRRASAINPEDNADQGEIAMDITEFGDMHLAFQQEQPVEEEEADQTMDMTQMFGSIKSRVEEEELSGSIKPALQNPGQSTSLLDQVDDVGINMNFTALGPNPLGPITRVNDQDDNSEQTMDFTKLATGKPEENVSDGEQTMEFTKIGQVIANNENDDGEEEAEMEFTSVVSRARKSLANDGEADMDFTSIVPTRQDNDDEEDMDFTSVAPARNSITGEEEEEEDMDFTNILPRRKSMINGADDEEDMDFTSVVPSRAHHSEDEMEDMDFTNVPSRRKSVANMAENEEEDMDFTSVVPVKLSHNDKEEDDEQEMEFTKIVGNGSNIANGLGNGLANVKQNQGQSFKIFEDDGRNKENQMGSELVTSNPIGNKRSLTPRQENTHQLSRKSPSTPTKASRSQRSSLRTPPSKSSVKTYTPGSTGRKRRRLTQSPSPEARELTLAQPPLTPSKSKQLEERIVEMSPKKRPRTPIKALLPVPKESENRYQSLLDGPVIASYTPLSKMRKDSIDPKQRLSLQPTSPTPDNNDTVLSRVSEGDEEEDSQYPSISLTEFLKKITIDFMDGLFLNSTRNQRQHQQEMVLVRGSDQNKESKLVDYAVAMAKIPTLELYNFSFQEMLKNITEARELFSQIDAETLEENPLLFREFIEAGPDLKQAMISQFKLIKNYARHQARGVWYDWRLQLTHGLKDALLKRKETVQHDKTLIVRKKAESDVNSIHSQVVEAHAKMKARLEILRQKTAELELYDRKEILSAREKLGAVKQQYKSAENQVSQMSQKVKAMEERIGELDNTRVDLENKIKECEKIKKDNRRIDVGQILKLESQFNGIQTCTGLKYHKIEGTILYFEILDSLMVAIDMSKKQLIEMTVVKSTSKCLQFFASNMLSLVNKKLGLGQQILECLRFWHAAYQINQDLENLELYHQVKLSEESVKGGSDQVPGLMVTVNLLNFDDTGNGNSKKSSHERRRFKAKVWIHLDAHVLTTFPSVRYSPDMNLNGDLGPRTKIIYSTNGCSTTKDTEMGARITNTLKNYGTAGLTEVLNKVVVEC